MLTLRPYQVESLDELNAYWQDGGGNGLVVIPTGGGKSLVIASLLRGLLETYPLMRIGMVTHSKELISQNFQELLAEWPSAPVGVYSAGIGRRDTRAAILFMGIQSVWNKVHLLGRFDLILVDEAHLISRNAETMYGKFFASLKAMDEGMRIAGFTATPYRLDSGRLDEGAGKIFDKVVYEANVADLIHQEFLSPLISKGGAAQINTQGVHRRGGDFIPGELEAAAMHGDLVARAAAEIVRYGQGRTSWLAFCSGIDHSEAVCSALKMLGVAASTIDGSMPKKQRDSIIQQFRQGAFKCLTSVNVLSIGFNVPKVDLIALLRPTASAGLYIQQVGRGLRLAPGKENCLVLDFAGNVKRHGPIDLVEDNSNKQASEKNEDDERIVGAPCKECPTCHSFMPIRVMECTDCGYIWEPEAKHEAKADTTPIMSGRGPDGYTDVLWTSYEKHHSTKSMDAPATLKVTYQTAGRKMIREWVCFDHPANSLPRQKADSFWLQMGGHIPTPNSVDEALARQEELRRVQAIKHEKVNDFDRVKGRIFMPHQLKLEGNAA